MTGLIEIIVISGGILLLGAFGVSLKRYKKSSCHLKKGNLNIDINLSQNKTEPENPEFINEEKLNS